MSIEIGDENGAYGGRNLQGKQFNANVVGGGGDNQVGLTNSAMMDATTSISMQLESPRKIKGRGSR